MTGQVSPPFFGWIVPFSRLVLVQPWLLRRFGLRLRRPFAFTLLRLSGRCDRSVVPINDRGDRTGAEGPELAEGAVGAKGAAGIPAPSATGDTGADPTPSPPAPTSSPTPTP